MKIELCSCVIMPHLCFAMDLGIQQYGNTRNVHHDSRDWQLKPFKKKGKYITGKKTIIIMLKSCITVLVVSWQYIHICKTLVSVQSQMISEAFFIIKLNVF